MGIFDTAKGAYSGNRAYHTHLDAGKLAEQGKVEQAREKFQTALRLYEDAVQHGNDAPNVLQAYSLLLLREGQFDRAKEIMVKMSRLKNLSDEERFQLRVQYSIYQWKIGELDKAMETIGRAAAYKMNGSVYGALGMFWVDKARQTGDFSEALAFNQKAMDYDDEDAATLDNMAQLYEAMAEGAGERAREYREKALGFYKKAHEERPRQITTIYYLARMLHQNGDDREARELLSARDRLYFTAICPVSREMMDALAREIG